MREQATDRPDVITVKSTMIDQSPLWAVYKLTIVVRKPANALRSVGLTKIRQDLLSLMRDTHIKIRLISQIKFPRYSQNSQPMIAKPETNSIHAVARSGGFWIVFRIHSPASFSASPLWIVFDFWRDVNVPGITRYPARSIQCAVLARMLSCQGISSASTIIRT